jgi:hypothetical protein
MEVISLAAIAIAFGAGVALLDPCPLIRGDIRFSGWEPIADEELRQIRQQLLIRRPAGMVAPVPVTPRPVIVKAKQPRPRR